MRDNLSPEEKLLRLIRGQDKTLSVKEAVAAVPAQAAKPQPIIFKRAHFLKGLFNIGAKKIIVITFILAVIYLALAFIYPLVYLRQVSLPQFPVKESPAAPQITKGPGRESLEHYLGAASGRQIFSTQSEQTQGASGAALEADLVKDIALVGIISGDNPQVIIENKKLKKTYYLSKGQFVGELKIEDVQEGKIILNRQGQKFELYL